MIHWLKEAEQAGGGRRGARGVIVRILPITQTTHPCLVTSCLAEVDSELPKVLIKVLFFGTFKSAFARKSAF